MNFEQYINNDYSPLQVQATVYDVKKVFEELPFTHFPVVDDGKLLGMLAQSDIMHFPKEEKELSEILHFFQHYKAQSETNCLDLMSLFAKNDTDILPIVDEQNYYLGYFEWDDIIRMFYKTPFLEPNATTLIIEKATQSFTMSEIVQIIETNGIKLLGMYLSDIKDLTTQITLRIETENINEVIQSLRRYDYVVLTQNKNDLLIEQLKERSLYLQKFYDL
jgi:predicted transcriptional regulator